MSGRLPTYEIARESRELRPVFVRAVDEDGVLVDVTMIPVEVSFVATKLGRPTTWRPAVWLAGGPFDQPPLGSSWQAEVEIGGPSTGADVELAAGLWHVWVRLTAAQERPVFPVGNFLIR